MTLPTYADIAAAARTIAGMARHTPLLRSDDLDERTGGRIFLKAEPLQVTGSFKFRGAYNRLANLTAEQRRAGVVAMSSGNHAQGVATAAKIVGCPATIVMPTDSPQLKLERTRAAGATVRLYDRVAEDRVAIAKAIAAERGAVVVPPYDDPWIIAGQGTAGLEIAADLKAMGLKPDAVLVNASGGGLTAGVALAVHETCAQARIFTAEPAGFDDHARSLRSGAIETNAQLSGSICDGLLAAAPGDITFAINREHAAGGVVVSDDEVRAAVAYAFRELKIVVEPSGAVGLAAILSGKIDARGQVVATILSGGNVDPALFATMIS